MNININLYGLPHQGSPFFLNEKGQSHENVPLPPTLCHEKALHDKFNDKK